MRIRYWLAALGIVVGALVERAEAADELGVERTTLYRLMKKLALE